MLNGGNVLSTSGDGAFGLYAIGGGVINANGPTFSAVGTPSITTSGNGSIALYASGGGSTITADGASIITHGASAPGVQADTGGLVTLNGGSVTTTGIDAPGVFVSGAGTLAMLNTTNVLTTSGDGAIGLFALGGGVIDATGPTAISTGNISTSTGLGAYGVNADGAGSQINLAAATVTTAGANAFGFYASNGGTISASGRTERRHVRKRRDRALRFRLGIDERRRRPIDHHRRRRFHRNAWSLSAGRAGRHRRARYAEWRFSDDHGQRFARRVRDRRRLAGDAQRRERLDHYRRRRNRTFTPQAAESSTRPDLRPSRPG